MTIAVSRRMCYFKLDDYHHFFRSVRVFRGVQRGGGGSSVDVSVGRDHRRLRAAPALHRRLHLSTHQARCYQVVSELFQLFEFQFFKNKVRTQSDRFLLLFYCFSLEFANCLFEFVQLSFLV